MPKYLEIENILTKRIQDGTYAPGAPFPKQSQLAEEFHTSRITIRKALDRLINVGLIYSQRGAGTFVRASKRFDTEIDQYVGTTKLLGKDHKIESKIIKFLIRYPNEEEQKNLLLTDQNLVYDIHRLRIVDQSPHSLEYTIMPVSIIPGIDENILKNSVYEYIENKLHQQIGPAYRIISAAKATADDQKYLKCAADEPILKVNQIISLTNNVPFEMSCTHHPHNKEKITVYLPGNNHH